MPNYSFESKVGVRIERFFKLNERPNILLEDSIEYYPVIDAVNFVGTEKTRELTPEEKLDQNIFNAFRDLEQVVDSQYLDQLDLSPREVKRMLEQGPLAPEDTFKEEKLLEAEAEAIKTNPEDYQDDSDDEPEVDLNKPMNLPNIPIPGLTNKQPSKTEINKMEARLKEVGAI